MRKIITPFLLLIVLVFQGCFEEPNTIDLTASEILAGKNYKVFNGVLTFKDWNSFKELASEVANKSDAELDLWETSIGFSSLRRLFNSAIDQDMAYINSLGNESGLLTRKEIGFSTEAKMLLEENLAYLDEYETLNLNISDDYLATLLNRSGVLRIDDSFILFQRDNIKILKSRNLSKLKLLVSATESDLTHNIVVNPVMRVTPNSENMDQSSRTNIVGSCESTNGNYRLLVYEEYTGVYPDIITCTSGALWTYKIKLRSLKKTLGIWNNYNTGFMRLQGSLKARHEVDCDGDGSNCTAYQPVTNATLSDQLNYSSTCAYGHTCYKYFFVNYDLATCNIWVCGDPYQIPVNPLCPHTSQIKFDARSHTGFGYNNTSCYVGW